MPLIHKILVPSGAEYKAVCRGLKGLRGVMPTVVPIPMGMKPLAQYLQKGQASENIHNEPQNILVMGICGSLTKHFVVGDVVLYRDCVYQAQVRECDRTLTTQLHSLTQQDVSLVKSLTSDRVIALAGEKLHLATTLEVDVVDMEGFAALEFFQAAAGAVAMLRVVSDDSGHDIPDLSSAINSEGSLQPLLLALKLLQEPIAATRLIRGSLIALKVLERVTNQLFATLRETTI
ncbi:MAG: phosphorylase [Desmonostoc vinosum HA7617-LM4]|nr:phosphorylase [Desmonostoc vinosum HA7617-LM4]